MTDARRTTFATYLDAQERDQLDARAATIDRLTAEMNEAMSILAKVGDAISPTGERPEEALGTLAADVRLVVDQRDEAVDALRDTLAELKDRTAERDEALNNLRNAWRQLDDMTTTAASYLDERDNLREQLDRANTERARLAAENADIRQQMGNANLHLAQLYDDGLVTTKAAKRLRDALAPPAAPVPSRRAQEEPAAVPEWRYLDPAALDDEPTRCRKRCADPLGLVHRCTKSRTHVDGHEWATDRRRATP